MISCRLTVIFSVGINTVTSTPNALKVFFNKSMLPECFGRKAIIELSNVDVLNTWLKSNADIAIAMNGTKNQIIITKQ